MNKLKTGLLVAILGSLALSGRVFAECELPSGAALTESISLGGMTVQRDLPIGAEIARKMIPANSILIANKCPAQAFSKLSAYTGSYPPAGDGVMFASGVAGVSLKIMLADRDVGYTTTTMGALSDGSSPIYNKQFEVRLIKTGTITPGTLTLAAIAKEGLSGDGVIEDAIIYNLTSGSITQASCEITGSSAIPVNMGEAKANDFQGKNSTLSPVNIQIPLQCDSGAKVNISFAAASSQGNGIIDLTSGGAEGVGIQLKLHDTPVNFDQTLFVAQATEQGAFTIPLTAAYIQTADVIKPGAANAVANFTVTYQ